MFSRNRLTRSNSKLSARLESLSRRGGGDSRTMFRYRDRYLGLVIPRSMRDLRTDSNAVVSIPIALLWNARIRLRQKLGIGALLCLSVVMIIIAIVKASGIRTPSDSFDILWELFWQQIEACVAVLMVSITAFRSLFTSHKPKATNKESPYRNFSKPLQHSPWSSRNKTEGAHSQHRSPASQQEHEMNPAYMTGSGSTNFQSVRSMEPTAEQIQHRLHSIDLEDNGCESELHDLPTIATRGDSHDEALILQPAV